MLFTFHAVSTLERVPAGAAAARRRRRGGGGYRELYVNSPV